jgi:hypothetical protein
MMARLQSITRSAGVWVNASLLMTVQYTDQILQAVNDNLPALASYVPPNVYKAVGIAVVVFNLVRAVQRANRAARANGGAHG